MQDRVAILVYQMTTACEILILKMLELVLVTCSYSTLLLLKALDNLQNIASSGSDPYKQAGDSSRQTNCYHSSPSHCTDQRKLIATGIKIEEQPQPPG